jgi:AraC-like DNA-binding protein
VAFCGYLGRMDTDADYHERCGHHPRVAAAWLLPGKRASASLVPADGCFDFIVEEDTHGRRSAFVYTPVTTAHWVRSEVGTRMFGVRLRPGYGAALVDCEGELRQLIERDQGDGLTLLDKLESLVVSSTNASSPPAIVHEFVSSARASAGNHRLTSASPGKVERELQRACHRWLGLRPKVFLRIERAWAARGAIRMGQPLAAVAADLGYADQAHLTRDVRQLLGVTPRELRPVGILQDSSTPNR